MMNDSAGAHMNRGAIAITGWKSGVKLKLAVIAFSLGWHCLMVGVPGRFQHYMDEIYYRGAGINLASNGKFAVPEFTEYGRLSSDYAEVFATYPPLYPLIYAAWLEVFPETYRVSLAYDCLINFALVVVVLFVLPKLLQGVNDAGVIGAGLVVSLLGTFERPDELGMALGYIGLAMWMRKGWTSAVLGGVFLGLCGCASFIVLFVLFLWCIPVWLSEFLRTNDKKRDFLLCVVCGGVCVLVLLLVLVPYYMRPGAWKQLTQASDQTLIPITAGLRYFAQTAATFKTFIYEASLFAALLVGALVAFLRSDRLDTKCHIGGVFLASTFLVLMFPAQPVYYWFLTPILMSVVFSNIHLRSVPGILMALGVLVAANDNFREFAKAWCVSRHPTQSAAYSARKLANIIPRNSKVVVDFKSYYMARPLSDNLVILHSYLETTGRVFRTYDYWVFGSFGLQTSSAGIELPRYWNNESLAWEFKRNFEKIYDNLPVGPPLLLGFPIGREPVGYGVVVYKRSRQ